MDFERLYPYLPVPLQNLAVTLEGWRLQRFRFRSGFQTLLKSCQERASWSGEAIMEWRDRRLRDFLAQAALTVPYYRDLFRTLRLNPLDIQGLDDLKQLPICGKREVQEKLEQFTSEAIPRRNCLVEHTSGTTGAGLHFSVTHAAHREQWAVWQRYRDWHGIALNTPCCYFGDRAIVSMQQRRPPYWRYNRAGRQILFSAYHLRPTTASAYLEEMQQSQAPWMHGYPSLISRLAAFALERRQRLPRLRWITVGAENLLPQQATIIEAAFGVKPLEHYGMAEGVANFSQCSLGRFHVDEDYAAVEFLPLIGQSYRIIGTNFTNLAFPLIRYDTGDIAELFPAGQTCPCGLPGRLVKSVDGRNDDFIVTKRGLHLRDLEYVFKNQVRVREAQIRQERAGRIAVLIVKGTKYSLRDEQSLREDLLRQVGDDVDFEIQYVEQLQRTSTGKLRFVISSVRQELAPT